MVLTVFAGIAEFERSLITERTSAGRLAAQEKGVRFGRPPKLSEEQIALGYRLRDEGTSVRDIARILNCHHATYIAQSAHSCHPLTATKHSSNSLLTSTLTIC